MINAYDGGISATPTISAKTTVPKLFLERPKSEFGGHPATQDANIVLKKYWVYGWILAVSC